MKSISYNELEEMLYNHKLWLNCRSGKKINLSYTDLSNIDLSDADLRYANLSNIKINYRTLGYHLACPEEGSFIGYKKANKHFNNYIRNYFCFFCFDVYISWRSSRNNDVL